jgi:nitric oxide reductase NorE protein
MSSRSSSAASSPTSTHPDLVPKGSAKRIPAEEGFWVLIFGDLTVFTAFFGTYLYSRARQPAIFRDSQRQLSQSLGLANTLLLLTGSLLVSMGVRAVRRGAPQLARPVFGGAILCAVGFVCLKALEWGQKLSHGSYPTTNNFFMYYFILTGLHLFHVLIGIAALIYLYTQAGRGAVTRKRLVFIEAGALFWHMVDLL